MVSTIESTQTRILSLIDIPQFSDDLRLVILDYMHPRYTVRVTLGGLLYWIRLGPSLKDNQLFLEIVAYNFGFSFILSTFGTYCQEKAINEYNYLINNISKISPFNWNQVFMTVYQQYDHLISYSLYAFCPDDQSTILFQIQQQKNERQNFPPCRLCFYQQKEDTKHFWRSTNYALDSFAFDVANRDMRRCHQLTLIYGSGWKSYYEKRTNIFFPQIELFDKIITP
jgi:hypothetical protein